MWPGSGQCQSTGHWKTANPSCHNICFGSGRRGIPLPMWVCAAKFRGVRKGQGWAAAGLVGDTCSIFALGYSASRTAAHRSLTRLCYHTGSLWAIKRHHRVQKQIQKHFPHTAPTYWATNTSYIVSCCVKSTDTSVYNHDA
jgi:hypothetical protein